MESAGKKLDADELRDAMAEKGLGTPATRAQIIEGLIEQSICAVMDATSFRMQKRSN